MVRDCKASKYAESTCIDIVGSIFSFQSIHFHFNIWRKNSLHMLPNLMDVFKFISKIEMPIDQNLWDPSLILLMIECLTM